MKDVQKKQYAKPEIEKIYVTEDAVLVSGESGGGSGSVTPTTPGGNEGEIDWFSLS